MVGMTGAWSVRQDRSDQPPRVLPRVSAPEHPGALPWLNHLASYTLPCHTTLKTRAVTSASGTRSDRGSWRGHRPWAGSGSGSLMVPVTVRRAARQLAAEGARELERILSHAAAGVG